MTAPVNTTTRTARPSRSKLLAAERLAAVRAQYIANVTALSKDASKGKDPAALLLALGCCEVQLRRGKGWCFDRPKQPDAVHETLILSTLCTFLKVLIRHKIPSHASLISTIDGLQQNHRWREVIKTVDGAYDFAFLLAQMTAAVWAGWSGEHSVETSRNKGDFNRSLRIRMLPILTEITNEWMHPRQLPGDVTPETLLGALFGEAWYSLMLKDDADNFRSWSILETIMNANPVFFPGLVTGQVAAAAEPLPDLDAP